MLMKTIRLQEPLLFHARPAAWIASEAEKYRSTILLTADGKMADAKKPLAVMRLGSTKDKAVELTLDGSDEEEALEAMVRVLESLVVAVN